jgi:predicted nucleic acid-binding protein
LARVYLDSNVFFYAKIMDRTYGRHCAEVLRSVRSGETEGSISALVPLEVANAMKKYGLAAGVADEIRAMFSLGLEVHPLEGTDSREVADVVGETGASPYDCAHAVVMKRYGIEEIVSADRDFDRFDWVRRIDPGSFRAKVR